jgi:hypothetical protein
LVGAVSVSGGRVLLTCVLCVHVASGAVHVSSEGVLLVCVSCVHVVRGAFAVPGGGVFSMHFCVFMQMSLYPREAVFNFLT